MKIWCNLCRRKVEATNIVERIVPVNHGSRKLVEGTDSKGHKVATYVSMKAPTPSAVKRTIKRKKRSINANSYGIGYL